MNIVSDANTIMTRANITFTSVFFSSFSDRPILQSINTFNVLFNIAVISTTNEVATLSLVALSLGMVGFILNLGLTYKSIEDKIITVENRQTGGSISD